jgi:hypothetical protein
MGRDESWTFAERLLLVLWAEVTFVISVVVVLGHPPEPWLAIGLGAALGLWLEHEAARGRRSDPAGR